MGYRGRRVLKEAIENMLVLHEPEADVVPSDILDLHRWHSTRSIAQQLDITQDGVVNRSRAL